MKSIFIGTLLITKNVTNKNIAKVYYKRQLSDMLRTIEEETNADLTKQITIIGDADLFLSLGITEPEKGTIMNSVLTNIKKHFPLAEGVAAWRYKNHIFSVFIANGKHSYDKHCLEWSDITERDTSLEFMDDYGINERDTAQIASLINKEWSESDLDKANNLINNYVIHESVDC